MRGTSISKSFVVMNKIMMRRIVNEAVQAATTQFTVTAITADS